MQEGVATGGQSEIEQELHAWMLLSLAGDAAAYEKLLGRIAQMMRKYLTHALNPSGGGPERAEDLVQEVLLAIHQKRHTYRPDLPLLPWVYAIARHRLIDSIRSNRRAPNTSPFEDGAEVKASMAQHERDQEALNFVGDADLGELLASLGEKQRKVLILAKLEEVPLAEIGKRLQMSLSAVKVTVHRAMASLSAQVKPTPRKGKVRRGNP